MQISEAVDAFRHDGLITADLLAAIEAGGDVRVLRRLDVREGRTGVGGTVGTAVGVALDCETTGTSDQDEIIELALRRFRFDPDGVIVKIDKPYSWLRDPGRPLDAEIVRLTGITDADVAGKVVDDDAVRRLLGSADFVCAHNARFDRGMVERHLSRERDDGGDAERDAIYAWACSCNDVDWRARGFDGRSLGWLLAQVGWFHGAHRAQDDVDAVIELLRHQYPTGGTVLRDMLDTARAPRRSSAALGPSSSMMPRRPAVS